MTETTRVTLRWGHNGCIPADSPGAWGARLIAPDDLVHDRQDASGEVATVLDKINSGILQDCKRLLRELQRDGWQYWFSEVGQWWPAQRPMRSDEANDVVLYMDDELCVVANTNGSYGYVYMTAFLFPKKED